MNFVGSDKIKLSGEKEKSEIEIKLRKFIESLDLKIDEQYAQELPVDQKGNINMVEMLRRNVRSATFEEVKYNLELLLQEI